MKTDKKIRAQRQSLNNLKQNYTARNSDSAPTIKTTSNDSSTGTDSSILSGLDNQDFIDETEIIARHSTALLFGNGIVFESVEEAEKRQEEFKTGKPIDKKDKVQKWIEMFDKENRLEEFMRTNSYWLSKVGRTIATIVPMQDGNYKIELADPLAANQVGKSLITETIAIIYKRPIKDNGSYLIREEWDKNKVIRTVTFNGDKTSLSNVNEQLPKDQQIKPVWRHNLGFLPLVEFRNKELDSYTYGYQALQHNFDLISDTGAVKPLIAQVQIINQIKVKELYKNVTRIIGNIDDQTLKGLSSNSERINYLLNDLLVKVSSDNPEKANMIQVMMGDPKLLSYDTSIEAIRTQIWHGSGYSYKASDDVMKTATETLHASSMDYRTTKLKRDYLNKKYRELFSKLLVAEGMMGDIYSPLAFSFSINDNDHISPKDKIGQIEKDLELGLTSKVRAIADRFDLNMVEAQMRYEEIKEEEPEEENDELSGQAKEGPKV